MYHFPIPEIFYQNLNRRWFEEFVKSIPKNIVRNFKNSCLKFYIKAVEEISTLSIINRLFQKCAKVCFNPMNRNLFIDLHNIIRNFYHIRNF